MTREELDKAIGLKDSIKNAEQDIRRLDRLLKTDDGHTWSFSCKVEAKSRCRIDDTYYISSIKDIVIILKAERESVVKKLEDLKIELAEL